MFVMPAGRAQRARGMARRNNLSDVQSAATSFANIKQAATASATGVIKRPRMAVLWDQKAQNTNSGTFTSAGSRTRDLNQETDPDGIVALAANQFVLAAGTYLIKFWAPAYKVDQHQASLYNVTATTTLIRGQSAYANAALESTVVSAGSGIVTLAASQTLEIRHVCASTRANNGFGLQTNLDTEIYTIVEIFSYDQ